MLNSFILLPDHIILKLESPNHPLFYYKLLLTPAFQIVLHPNQAQNGPLRVSDRRGSGRRYSRSLHQPNRRPEDKLHGRQDWDVQVILALLQVLVTGGGPEGVFTRHDVSTCARILHVSGLLYGV